MTNESGRLKVLICAYTCEPDRGSEPGVGWNWAVQAARDHEVWVLTTSERELEADGRHKQIPNLHFVYYKLPGWARRLAPSERLRYLYWQVAVMPAARRLQRQIGFDLVHQLTFISLEAPGLLWSLGVPFVWGPVGGGQAPPRALRSYFRDVWPVEIARGWRKRLIGLNPLVRIAARRSAWIVASNRDTARCLDGLTTAPIVIEPEIGIDATAAPPSRDEHYGFTIAWAGRLIPRKGPLLALDVAQALKRRGVRFRLRMAGDGPWRKLIEREIAQRGLRREVTIERVSYAGMHGFYGDGDAFLFTSLQDTNGTVLLEAMASGLPVVCLDHQGAADLIGDDCGFKVRVQNKAQVIEGMATALAELADDRGLRERLGENGRRRVGERYTWELKREFIARLYQRVATRSHAAATPQLVEATR
ncbi:MAG TPA: glycosyltransferase family 4 protein [Dehalococcoidia bacterium]|nr:glycosyltransferase family 4 protein [Dehalococcoidia bacterium]